jgi:hypothetical protein
VARTATNISELVFAVIGEASDDDVCSKPACQQWVSVMFA